MARDSDTPLPFRTEVTTSLSAELIFAANLAAGVGRDRPGVAPGWAASQRDLLPTSVRGTLAGFSVFWWPTMGLVDFLCLNGLFDDPKAFAKDVAGRPVEEFLSVLLNGDLTPDEVAPLVGTPGAATQVLPQLSRFSQGPLEALEGLFLDPEGHRRRLLDLVEASDTPLFRQAFSGLQTQATPSIRTLEHRLAVEDPMAVAQSLRDRPLRPGSGPYDRYTFVPSALIGHPHIQSWGGGHAVFFFQEGASVLTAPTEVGTELAEFLKVLGDPTRMDILRLLCCGPSYGKEIATVLRLTTATVSRHLDQLKAAGLVREDRADANNVKKLRYVPEALEGQWERLKTYLFHT